MIYKHVAFAGKSQLVMSAYALLSDKGLDTEIYFKAASGCMN